MIDLRVVSTEVHDKAWLGRQPAGTVAPYVAPKGDSGNDALTLAKGAGYGGGDCLLVTSQSPEAGLPGFWLMVGKSNGRGAVANCAGNDGYLAEGQRANRLSFWLRFEEGFRATSSAKAVQNFHVGTYHYDPLLKGVRKESNNWHFYHQLILRHDLAEARWMHVVVNDVPQHQRSLNGAHPAPNPTRAAGNYWELLTRCYFDLVPYFCDPENGYPARMWVDDISLEYVEPLAEVTVLIEPPVNAIVSGQTTTLRVKVTNHRREAISGIIGHRSHYAWTPNLVEVRSNKSVHTSTVKLDPGINYYELLLTPRMNLRPGQSQTHAVVFVPATQLTPGNVSHADPAVRLHLHYGVSGPCDSQMASDQITLKVG